MTQRPAPTLGVVRCRPMLNRFELSLFLYRLLSRSLLGLLLFTILMFLGGCAELGYYAQSIEGQLRLLSRRENIDTLIESQKTPAELKRRLSLVRTLRRFAAQSLDLPANGSYSSYADLKRPYAVATVVAAPPLSLMPLRWCFLIVGCLSYRGYFEEADAKGFANDLADQGLDVHVGRVRAYSTLGWFDDPILNTFVYLPDPALAGLIFHELTHQRLYIPGDTAFNEAYAVAVAQHGVELWLAVNPDPILRSEYMQSQMRAAQFRTLVAKTRMQLQAVYSADSSDASKLKQKIQVFAQMRIAYSRLKLDWGGYEGYDHWFDENLNNARLALIATYHELVPGFYRLMQRENMNMPKFHQAVRKLADLSPEQRHAYLIEMSRN